MGQTSKPLYFVIEKELDGPTFDALRAQGHTVDIRDYRDVMGIFGPKCWRMDKRVADDPKLFEVALKSMREVYYNGVEHPKTVKTKASQTVTKPATVRKPRRRVTTAVTESDSGVGEVSRKGTDDAGQTSLFTRHEEGDVT